MLLAFVGTAQLHSAAASQSDLERFRQAQHAVATDTAPSPDSSPSAVRPDLSLWDESRIAAWKASLEENLGLPLAVMRIPRLALEVPVWEGVDELTLNRGLGHIPGTAAPGAAGNLGIAGHRDGFFRVLKDIRAGDVLEIERLDGVDRFTVERTLVVAPEDVWVLDPTPGPSVTLVTCYPFYFSGKAPQRFIVKATRQPSDSPDAATTGSSTDPGRPPV